MNVKKTIRKLVALGTGATMVGATIMGAMADLGSYPEPFVKDGVLDTMIVIGANAAAMDTLGAIDIAASLQAAAATPVATGGAAGTTTVTGDNVEISRSSNLLEVNQFLGDVRKTLTEGDLKALTGGTITAGGKTTKYNQYLRLNFTDVNQVGKNSGQVVYDEDTKEDVTGDFLKFASGDYFFEYQLEFSDGLESDNVSATLEDIEDESMNIFGQDFTVTTTAVAAGSGLTLTFMAGDVTDTLGEGETKTYTIDGVDYEVTAIFISDSGDGSTKFSVNGEITKELNEGETDVLAGGLEIGVRAILTNQREGIVEFYLGANKVVLQDTNYVDDTYYQGVEVAGEDIENARVKIKASNVGTKIVINSIYYQLKAKYKSGGGAVYVAPGHGIREYIYEPAGMLNPTWDIKYEGLTDVETRPLAVRNAGDDAYYLEFTNTEGLEYNIPLLDDSLDTAQIGSDTENLWFYEYNITNYTGYRIAEDDYFIVSDRNDDQGMTHVLQFTGVDTGSKKVLLTDLAGGSKEVSYNATSADLMFGVNGCSGSRGDLVVGGATYTVYVCGSEDDGSAYKLSVDLDADGLVSDGNKVNITTWGGALVSINNITQTDTVDGDLDKVNFDLNVTVPQRLFDENGPYATTGILQAGTDMVNGINITQGLSSVDLSVTANNYIALKNDQTNNDYKYALDPYGAFWKYYNPTGTNEADSVTIDIPKQQRGAQVFITAGNVKATKSGASTGGAYVINKAATGIAVLDSDVTLGRGNLIVVGGPCVNTIAQELMGNPENCAEGFEPGKAVIKLYDSKNALLVAGYGWQDTLGAAYVLADYEDYDLSGMEMEVVVADLDTISVNKVG
ncbi:MAG: hypothetical protein ABIJ21_00475 [Nanoarchaeota archaeon]